MYPHALSLMLRKPLAVFLSALCLVLGAVSPASALRGMTERDHGVSHYQDFHGFTPVKGEGYTISLAEARWPQQVTFAMETERKLLVKVAPGRQPAGVVMSASRAVSLRLLKAVWGHDDLRQPMIFWTDRFWTPAGGCQAGGCPKIRFQATRGTVEITVLDVR